MTSKNLYVLDTHALVWFLKRNTSIGRKALTIMLSGKSCLVVPIYLIDEIRHKSLNNNETTRPLIGLPPSTVLRLICGARNIVVFPRSPGVVIEEERLRRAVTYRKLSLDRSDIPICATAIAIQKANSSVHVFLLSKDGRIRKCADIPTIWN